MRTGKSARLGLENRAAGFEQVEARTGTNKDGEAIKKTLEGEHWYWDYGSREGGNVEQKAVNQTLSEKRAQAVKGCLVAHGIDASRLNA